MVRREGRDRVSTQPPPLGFGLLVVGANSSRLMFSQKNLYWRPGHRSDARSPSTSSHSRRFNSTDFRRRLRVAGIDDLWGRDVMRR
jgi:hypothetical protein